LSALGLHHPGLRSTRKVIFRRALLREFSNLALAVFATLFAITLTTQLIRLLGQAAIGKVLSEGVLALLAFSALNYLPILLSLTLFITVLITLSRSYPIPTWSSGSARGSRCWRGCAPSRTR